MFRMCLVMHFVWFGSCPYMWELCKRSFLCVVLVFDENKLFSVDNDNDEYEYAMKFNDMKCGKCVEQ